MHGMSKTNLNQNNKNTTRARNRRITCSLHRRVFDESSAGNLQSLTAETLTCHEKICPTSSHAGLMVGAATPITSIMGSSIGDQPGCGNG